MEKRLSLDELAQLLEAAKDKIEVGGTYQHYKGGEYKVEALAILESSNEACVIYRALYDLRLTFVRPAASWLESVNVDGAVRSRFVEVASL